MTTSITFIFFFLLALASGIIERVYRERSIRHSLFPFYAFLWFIFVALLLSGLIPIPLPTKFRFFSESNQAFFININALDISLFSLLIIFFLGEGKKSPSPFWALACSYLALALDSYLITILAFEALTCPLFAQKKSQRPHAWAHFALGSLFIIWIFTEMKANNFPLFSTIIPVIQMFHKPSLSNIGVMIALPLFFTHTLSFLNLHKGPLFPYLLLLALALRPFGLKAFSHEVFLPPLLFFSTLFGILNFKTKNDPLISILLSTLFLTISVFFMGAISYPILLGLFIGFATLHEITSKIPSHLQKPFLFALSFYPPSPFFFLVVTSMQSPLMTSPWIQGTLFLLGITQLHQLISKWSLREYTHAV